jgi:hypothetical protein
VDHNTLICASNALILPHLDYCCEIWDTIGATLSDRLDKLRNRAARVITGRKNEHGQSELALDDLKWKPLSERRTHFVASLMDKNSRTGAKTTSQYFSKDVFLLLL